MHTGWNAGSQNTFLFLKALGDRESWSKPKIQMNFGKFTPKKGYIERVIVFLPLPPKFTTYTLQGTPWTMRKILGWQEHLSQHLLHLYQVGGKKIVTLIVVHITYTISLIILNSFKKNQSFMLFSLYCFLKEQSLGT